MGGERLACCLQTSGSGRLIGGFTALPPLALSAYANCLCYALCLPAGGHGVGWSEIQRYSFKVQLAAGGAHCSDRSVLPACTCAPPWTASAC